MLTADMLLPGESGVVVSVGSCTAQRSRLMDMGLVPGAVLKMKEVSPFGDPVIVSIRHTDVSLRKEQAQLVVLRREL